MSTNMSYVVIEREDGIDTATVYADYESAVIRARDSLDIMSEEHPSRIGRGWGVSIVIRDPETGEDSEPVWENGEVTEVEQQPSIEKEDSE